jgi:hypothetical protein
MMMKTHALLTIAAAMFTLAPALPAAAQTAASGSCETLRSSNPAAYEQLCASQERAFPEYADPVLGDGDTETVYDCGMVIMLQPGERIRVAC